MTPPQKHVAAPTAQRLGGCPPPLAAFAKLPFQAQLTSASQQLISPSHPRPPSHTYSLTQVCCPLLSSFVHYLSWLYMASCHRHFFIFSVCSEIAPFKQIPFLNSRPLPTIEVCPPLPVNSVVYWSRGFNPGCTWGPTGVFKTEGGSTGKGHCHQAW